MRMRHVVLYGRNCLLAVCFLLMLQAFPQQEETIMTVTGPILASALGKTLIHEHLVTNFKGTEARNQTLRHQQLAVDQILPQLLRLKARGYATLVECTPSHIGKNVALLRQLSEASGLNLITNTGYYAAVNKKYLPDAVYTKTAEELATDWEAEWRSGIAGTGIRPGFIKLGVGGGPLDPVEEKLVRAGFLMSETSGLPLFVHTGGDASIRSQYRLAKEQGFDPDRLVWVHAQNGSDSTRLEMARNGVWVSLDGVNENRIPEYLQMIRPLKEAGLLGRVLLSHDDGWSLEGDDPDLILTLFDNGNRQPYRTIPELLEAALLEQGFVPEELLQLFTENPRRLLTPGGSQ